jgi:hypothetical protein
MRRCMAITEGTNEVDKETIDIGGSLGTCLKEGAVESTGECSTFLMRNLTILSTVALVSDDEDDGTVTLDVEYSPPK